MSEPSNVAHLAFSEDERGTQNAHAETALLAAVLTGHPAAIETLDQVASRDFYQPRNAAVWDACHAAHAQGDRIDPRTLPVPPQARPYLVEVMTSDITAEPLVAAKYARAVVDAAQRRRLVEAAVRIRQLAETAEDASAAAQDARAVIDDAASSVTDEDSGIGAADLVRETIDALERGEVHKTLTGWTELDEFTGGMRPGQLVVIGARPGYGKSVCAANIASAACRAGTGVHFASLEMTRGEVMNRLLADRCTVQLGHLMEPEQLTESDWTKLAQHSGEVTGWPLHVDDAPAQTLNQIRARARSTARRLPLGMIIVDYLQIMNPAAKPGTPREQQIGDLSLGLKNLAKEMQVPVIALAQVNRGAVERKDPRPLMSDLRESGRIEADADQILLLHRPDLVDPDFGASELHIHVAKNRNGPTGRTVELEFWGHYSRASARRWSSKAAL